MLRPKRTLKMMIGMVASTKPDGVKSKNSARLPHWKTKTRAPKEAEILSTVMMTALMGRITEPSNSTRIK